MFTQNYKTDDYSSFIQNGQNLQAIMYCSVNWMAKSSHIWQWIIIQQLKEVS